MVFMAHLQFRDSPGMGPRIITRKPAFVRAGRAGAPQTASGCGFVVAGRRRLNILRLVLVRSGFPLSFLFLLLLLGEISLTLRERIVRLDHPCLSLVFDDEAQRLRHFGAGCCPRFEADRRADASARRGCHARSCAGARPRRWSSPGAVGYGLRAGATPVLGWRARSAM